MAAVGEEDGGGSSLGQKVPRMKWLYSGLGEIAGKMLLTAFPPRSHCSISMEMEENGDWIENPNYCGRRYDLLLSGRQQFGPLLLPPDTRFFWLLLLPLPSAPFSPSRPHQPTLNPPSRPTIPPAPFLLSHRPSNAKIHMQIGENGRESIGKLEWLPLTAGRTTRSFLDSREEVEKTQPYLVCLPTG